MKKSTGLALSGAGAGFLNGFFGGTGGSVLVPGLEKLAGVEEKNLFPAAIRIMVPICLVSLVLTKTRLPWAQVLPWLLGSGIGGLIAPMLKDRVPVVWLHRILGLLILLGGGRMLWS